MTKTAEPMLDHKDPSHPWNKNYRHEINWVLVTIREAARTDEQIEMADLLECIVSRSAIKGVLQDMRLQYFERVRRQHVSNQFAEKTSKEAERKAKIRKAMTQ